ncbi:GNAT family N-acetyltransferase [Alphaproteobacteria bacterium]|nr:GNAT family N-acetyltransferase [Alphaproteobacteria bacterium]
MPSLKSDFFFIDSLKKIKKEDWNTCVDNDHPFIQYEFLFALEKSESACSQTGWKPHHYIECNDKKEIIAICPLYLKSHSYGEYIFDHAWADAYHRHGLNYYPKLQSAIPFTPVTGDRIFISQKIRSRKDKIKEIINNIINEAKKLNVSSAHFNFIKNPNEWSSEEPIMIREGIQFHWENNHYKSFDDFLSTLSSRKRKQIKKERQCLKINNLRVELLSGDDLKKEDLEFFYECYLDTTGRKWGSTYLKKEFFMNILKNFKDKILLMIAYQNDNKVASALNFLSKTHLYGRLWGSKFEVPYLHFELCYYQAIDYAIANNIKYVEAGAQGEHKLSRGYLPQKTWSAHWIKEKDFSTAINKFLNEETKMINNHKEDLEALGPYKN